MTLDVENTLTLLQQGTIEPEGRIAWGSNYTMLAQICLDEQEGMVVYKPQRGERPLWDFPSGTLCNRERAAWLVCRALGWQIVPPTILREGPYGVGSVQFFIDHDPNEHYFDIQGQTEHEEQLQQIVLFDLITNNADRKAGHVLIGSESDLWAIDHGICFHVEYKLRTVIWEFQGRPIAEHHRAALVALQATLAQLPPDAELRVLLSADEIAAMQTRLVHLLNLGIFPEPGAGRHYPWPPI